MNDMDLSEFLLARIGEDKERATFVRNQIDGRFPEIEPWRLSWEDEYDLLCVEPSRALAECEAKRDIVNHLRSAMADEERALRTLSRLGPDHREAGEEELAATRVRQAVECIAQHAALPYADHPDYRQEWAVQ